MCKTLETNLQTIAARARQLDQENQDFKAFLRRIPSHRLDTLVETLNAEVEAQIDCTTCGNCCKHLHAAALETELPALAAYQKLSVEEFKTKFLTPYKEAFYFSTTPCPMLQSDNHCSIYEQRPLSCRTFPNLTAPHFKYRFHSVMEKYPICPIVFNVVEKLKSALGFKNAAQDSEAERATGLEPATSTLGKLHSTN